MEDVEIQNIILAGKARRNANAQALRRRQDRANSMKRHAVGLFKNLFSNSAKEESVPKIEVNSR